MVVSTLRYPAIYFELQIFQLLKHLQAAAVWLKKGECLSSLGRLEEAALAYARVVNLAPNHLDARLFLASLHQQLGRPNQALDVLSGKSQAIGAEETIDLTMVYWFSVECRK